VYAGPRIYRRTDGQLVWFKGVVKQEGEAPPVEPPKEIEPDDEAETEAQGATP